MTDGITGEARYMQLQASIKQDSWFGQFSSRFFKTRWKIDRTMSAKGRKKLIETQQFTIGIRMKKIIEQAQFEANRLWVKDIKPVHFLLAAVDQILPEYW